MFKELQFRMDIYSKIYLCKRCFVLIITQIYPDILPEL